MTVVWANVLFLGVMGVACAVMAAVTVLVVEKYREDRRLADELAECGDEPPLPRRNPDHSLNQEND